LNLIEALQKQIEYCKYFEKYRCGIFVAESRENQIMQEFMQNMINEFNEGIKFKYNSCECIVQFSNGSYIKIIIASDNARGYRWNGVIISNNVNSDLVQCVILPKLMPLHVFDNSDEPMNRVYYCDIPITKRLPDCSRGINPLYIYEQRLLAQWLDITNRAKIFKKEYECMFETNNYDHAIVDKELNGARVLLYEAWGIPKDKITYETEFVNKAKQTYLNIKGKYSIKDIGFENDLNIHLLIDTDVYDGYEVKVEDGMVTVELHEIENEKPELKDLSVE